ncbi:MAG: UbiD family decarboxylase [Chloroflexi bacterium]|nr:UbiD family decarboxylase [Chloroflexota bacterium]
MAYYRDLREHMGALEALGKLVRIGRRINKDTELMPLVRCQFRGLPEEERKAFLFQNVTDVKGRSYRMPVLVASHAASTAVYALGMMCEPHEIQAKLTRAQLHPIEPQMVESGPIHEEVHAGASLLEHGGLDEIPVPISTPGFDNAPYFTCANFVTKDPETGVRNIGNYRAMIKSQTRTGAQAGVGQHMAVHWEKCRSLGIPLQAAVVIGASPNIGYVSGAKFAYGVDEYAVAGAIAGAPVDLVKCKTVDLEVPAGAELVIEGEILTDVLEREAPFGEFTGYMGEEYNAYVFNVTAITHRKDAMYNAFLSQFTPSESSKLKSLGCAAGWYKYLRHDKGIPGIVSCAFPDNPGGAGQAFLVIQMKKHHPSDSWTALHAAVGNVANWPRVFVAVDEDIDPWDADAVNWAISFRVEPQRDVRIVKGKAYTLDQAGAPPMSPLADRVYPPPDGGSALLIDATMSWPYRPVSLPKREFMDRALEIWEEEGLPKLNLRAPWFGYSLGWWTEENEQEAQIALRGEHYQTGEKLAQRRIKL